MHFSSFLGSRAELSTKPIHCSSPYSDYTALVLFLLLEAAFGAVPPAASKASHGSKTKEFSFLPISMLKDTGIPVALCLHH